MNGAELYLQVTYVRVDPDTYDPQTGTFDIAKRLFDRQLLRSMVERIWGLDAIPLPAVPEGHLVYLLLATVDGEERVVRAYTLPSIRQDVDDDQAEIMYSNEVRTP